MLHVHTTVKRQSLRLRHGSEQRPPPPPSPPTHAWHRTSMHSPSPRHPTRYTLALFWSSLTMEMESILTHSGHAKSAHRAILELHLTALKWKGPRWSLGGRGGRPDQPSNEATSSASWVWNQIRASNLWHGKGGWVNEHLNEQLKIKETPDVLLNNHSRIVS